MEITVKELTGNDLVLELTRTTVWKDSIKGKMPSEYFMEQIYMAEHSPIYNKWFKISITGIKSWIATHLVRHNVGYTPYVSTSREDRIEYNITEQDIEKLSSIPFYEGVIDTGNVRDLNPQGSLVNIDIVLNAMSYINVSKKRLCKKAHKETVLTWNKILEELKPIDEQLYLKCVPTCIYRGFCPEIKPCGFSKTDNAKKWRKVYLNGRENIDIGDV